MKERRKKKWQTIEWDEQFPVWVIGVILFGLFLVAGLIDRLAPNFFSRPELSCFVRKYVGMYCTGCGATRAVLSLTHGAVMDSLYYNAVVLYVTVFYGIFVVRGAMYLFSKGKYSYMKFRVLYVYIGLGITVVQAVVKNVALFVYHYQWMA